MINDLRKEHAVTHVISHVDNECWLYYSIMTMPLVSVRSL